MNNLIDKLAEELVQICQFYVAKNDFRSLEFINNSLQQSDNYTLTEKQLAKTILLDN